jgi:pimeloyl-ACP methyl ester carboxylesterase
LVLLHGFGASTYSWEKVIQPLTGYGRVIAYDRPAFGLTDRPIKWKGGNPYSTQAQVDQLLGLMDALGIEQAILVGNSAGGRIAFETALQHPERVLAIIAVDAAVYSEGGTPSWLKPLLRTPQMRRIGPLIARRIQENGDEIIRRAWHDPSLITEEVYLGYREPLQIANWDRALWELSAAPGINDLAGRIPAVQQPTLVITGDDDRIVPTELSIQLAGDLPNAELSILPNCGHVPQEECPDLFLDAIDQFLIGLPD